MNGQKVVEVATKEIGNGEAPKDSNKTKYGQWFGYNGVPWCAIFVSWCYHLAGCRLGNIGFIRGFAGCQTAVLHFTKTNEITTTPEAGDIVFYDWNNDKRYDHTGIFVKWISKTTFEAIEGNTSFGNDSNGGQVMRRQRNIRNCIFVHPKVLD
jgi:hypothetical protein